MSAPMSVQWPWDRPLNDDELDGLLDVDSLSRVDALDVRRFVRIVVSS